MAMEDDGPGAVAPSDDSLSGAVVFWLVEVDVTDSSGLGDRPSMVVLPWLAGVSAFEARGGLSEGALKVDALEGRIGGGVDGRRGANGFTDGDVADEPSPSPLCAARGCKEDVLFSPPLEKDVGRFAGGSRCTQNNTKCRDKNAVRIAF